MKYSFELTPGFKKDYKLVKKQNKDIDKLMSIISRLIEGEKLEKQYHDHKLTGKFKNYRECHIGPDWLLVYRIVEDKLVLVRTGSHSELFK
ncbi:MAG: type II toxin-antitoxin system YafQ family toxin [Bacteroidetes bacterium]|nr:type II toxin-antitoxin system YafQ family toxin [Bacteroidota bacterium]